MLVLGVMCFLLFLVLFLFLICLLLLVYCAISCGLIRDINSLPDSTHSKVNPNTWELLLLQGLNDHVDKASVLGLLVSEGQESLAEKWATGLGHDFQVTNRGSLVVTNSSTMPCGTWLRVMSLQTHHQHPTCGMGAAECCVQLW